MSEGRAIPDDVSPALQNYLETKSDIPKTTYKNHRSVGKRFEEWLVEERDVESILDADPVDVKDWLQRMANKGYQGSTVHQYHHTLKSIYSEWVPSDGVSMMGEQTALEKNPANFNLSDYVDAPRKPRKQEYADNEEGIIYLSAAEIRKLQRHVPAPKVRNRLIIKILVQTGLRRGELASLELAALDREAKMVTVEAKKSKTNQSRTVPYDDLDPEISMWLDGGHRDRFNRADESDYLLLNRQSPKLSPSRISSMVREAADAADLHERYMEDARGSGRRRVTAHTLRATFTMRLVDAGIPMAKVQKLTGHEKLETVESYANVASEDAADAYREADIQFS